jgi:hypothetical protein
LVLQNPQGTEPINVPGDTVVDCAKSPDGKHHIPRGPPFTQKDFEEWHNLSEEERVKSQFCIHCGVAIW